MVEKTLKFRGKDITNGLIVVPGHATICYGLEIKNPLDDSSWFLRPFQKGEPKYYIDHIAAGVKASHETGRLLVFSGAPVHADALLRSEALGYLLIAKHYNWFGKPEVESRAVIEDYAGDSFENGLFSICRYRECTGEYPDNATVAGWTFKAERFKLHFDAIRFQNFTYLGVNNPEDLELAMKGEKSVIEQFKEDPYGHRKGPSGRISVIAQKRIDRNPFNRMAPYKLSCPEIAGLLRHEGPKTYTGPLPWHSELKISRCRISFN